MKITPVSKIITHQRRGHNVHLLVTWIHHTRGIPNSKIPRWIHHTRGIPISKTDSTPQNHQVQEWRQDNIYTQEKATWNFEVHIPIDITLPSRKKKEVQQIKYDLSLLHLSKRHDWQNLMPTTSSDYLKLLSATLPCLGTYQMNVPIPNWPLGPWLCHHIWR